MKSLGLRDIIGPIMVGPSSSHTAGALRIAQMARSLLADEPAKVVFRLYGSFAYTYRGHGTDRALVAGMLGLHTDDLRIRDSFSLARERGLDFSIIPDTTTKTPHPNTVDIEATDRSGGSVSVRGVSIGGGAAELARIDDIDVSITGEFNALIVHQIDTPGVLAHISQTMGKRGVNIGTVVMHRRRRGGEAFTVLEIDDPVPEDAIREVLSHPSIISVRFVPADGLNRRLKDGTPRRVTHEDLSDFEQLDFVSARELLERCEDRGLSISEAFCEREEALLATLGEDRNAWRPYLERVLKVMRESVEQPLERPMKSMAGLIGGEARRVQGLHQRKGAGNGNSAGNGNDGSASRSILGDMTSTCVIYALAVLECNASMGRIVAAPTAGSSGVLPATLLALADCRGASREDLVRGLLNAAAIGYLIARNATVAGAEGGCQAEIGAASAMAASALCEIRGGSPRACMNAAGIALADMLGLVCDPVGGMVEAPCQTRNASAAANALVAAECALAGVESLAPLDEVIEAMLKVGRALPSELRETALGGMAACPSCIKRAHAQLG